MDSDRLLVAGETCWRVERAEQFACIVDGADYFRHCKAAMLRAQRRIVLIGWDFDTRLTFEPAGKTLQGPNQLGPFLRWLIRVRPRLEVYLLRSNLRILPAFDGLWGDVTPVALLNWITSERLQFAIDGEHPTGAVHHQKIVVIDDALALCGGIDLTSERWDTREHLDDNEFRKGGDRVYGPRHEVATAMDGAAARALGDTARDRWRIATGQYLAQVVPEEAIWPPGLEPMMRNVDVGIARTLPELTKRSEVREVEALNLAAIAAARRRIYLENQYLASRTLVDALVQRLKEPDGPEIVIVMPRNSESRLEEQSMDSARHRLLRMLWEADEYLRLGVYWPVTEGDTPVYVHSKVLVVDDRLLRIGSSNLNNRSMGFDSECDVAVEADPDVAEYHDVRAAITAMRNGLVSEHLGVSVEDFERALDRSGSLLQAVETLRGDGRTLQRFTIETVANEASLLAENDLMDPDHVPKSLARSVQRWLDGFTK
ncbi:phospholipase D-like domain-containing protein [Mycolicibacterium sp. CR10]|uniref:phospholipase D-like domain-containing protein n=1 Tax=Mycolicibacterium sp. CR10 TaxID=2562314 RepID=UPI0010C03FC1|nr:phospholipase D-like domain-containing protein [Mycolicibacterium sp. CR10]